MEEYFQNELNYITGEKNMLRMKLPSYFYQIYSFIKGKLLNYASLTVTGRH
jgi:hypothetical protein